jgi:hypothetical protein
MEIPDLSISSIWCLDNHISVVNQVEVSVLWQLRNNVEVSLNVKTELLVELSLSWFSLPFINVDNIPLLVESVVLVLDFDVSVFSINISLDMEYLYFFVAHVDTSVSEHLPTS